MESIKNQLESLGYDYAVAISTQAEIESGAACDTRLMEFSRRKCCNGRASLAGRETRAAGIPVRHGFRRSRLRR